MKYLRREILRPHLLYFWASLSLFQKKYFDLIFKNQTSIPKHLAYLCPLCLKNFLVELEEERKQSSEFTLDHFPPESVGGKLKILTCKKCNNEAGAYYESELINKMNYEATLSNIDNAKIPAKFSLIGIPGNFTCYIKKNNKDKLDVNFPIKSKNQSPFLNYWLENKSNNTSWEGKMTIQRPNDEKVVKALLKTAYLICFANFGYDFTFSSNGELIRAVLNNKEVYPCEFPLFWLNKKDLSLNFETHLGLRIIEKPINLQTFAVNIALNLNDNTSIACILIPFPGKDGWEKLKEINNFQKNKPQVAISFKKVVAVLPNNIFDGYTKAWNDFILSKEIDII